MHFSSKLCLLAVSALVAAQEFVPIKPGDLRVRQESEELSPIKVGEIYKRDADQFEGREEEIMIPIHARDFDIFRGLYKREQEQDLSRLALQDKAQMIFGSKKNGTLLIANMTITAPSGSKIISMENFEGHTSEIDCEGHDGEMSLTFTSPRALAEAKLQWTAASNATDKFFYLIANHDGCGPKNQRQAYQIDNVDVPKNTLKAVLKSKPVEWKDIMDDFTFELGEVPDFAGELIDATGAAADELDFDGENEGRPAAPAPGSVVATLTSAPIARRTAMPDPGLWDKFTSKAANVGDKITSKAANVGDKITSKAANVGDKITSKAGSVGSKVTSAAGNAGSKITSVGGKITSAAGKGASKVTSVAGVVTSAAGQLANKIAGKNDWTLDIDTKSEGKTVQILKTTGIDLTCQGCTFKGQFKFHTRIEHTANGFGAFLIDASAKDMKAKFQLGTKLDIVGKNLKTFSANIVPSTGIPVLTIPKLFAIGPTVRLEAAGSISMGGKLDAVFGFETTVPDKTGFTLDFKSPKKSKHSGWDKVSTKPIFKINEAAVQFDITVVATPIIALEISAGDGAIFRVAADLQFDLPRIKTSITPGYDAAGFCPGNKKTGGVKIKSDLDLLLDMGLTGELLGTDIGMLTGNVGVGRFQLYKFHKNLADTCIAFGKDAVPGGKMVDNNPVEQGKLSQVVSGAVEGAMTGKTKTAAAQGALNGALTPTPGTTDPAAVDPAVVEGGDGAATVEGGTDAAAVEGGADAAVEGDVTPIEVGSDGAAVVDGVDDSTLVDDSAEEAAETETPVVQRRAYRHRSRRF